MENRIRELREARGWSQFDLGSRIGMGKSDVSRLENGKTQLKLDVAKRIADALNVSIAEVLALEDEPTASPGWLGESNVVEYTPQPGDPFAGLQGEHRYLMLAKDDALDRIGIRMGDVVVVDDSAAICANPPPLAGVKAPSDVTARVSLPRNGSSCVWVYQSARASGASASMPAMAAAPKIIFMSQSLQQSRDATACIAAVNGVARRAAAMRLQLTQLYR